MLRLPPTSAVKKRPEERRKSPYSPNINLITTQLSIAANRLVVNRFSYSTLRKGLTTSSCASPRHARDLSLILSFFLSVIFSKIFVGFQSRPSQFRCRVLHTISSTISTGKKEKTEVEAEVGEGVLKNPQQIWPYLFGILFNSFPN